MYQKTGIIASFLLIITDLGNTVLRRISENNLIYILCFLIYFPILQWNGYFLDDNYRSIYGYYAWTSDYRPIADYIYYFLGTSFEFIDIYPLNYFIQIILIFFFLKWFNPVLIKKYNLNDIHVNYFTVGFFMILANPFFLQNLYFRYDSLPMLLSVLIVLNSILINSIRYNFLVVLVILFTYQSSISGYVIFSCMQAVLINYIYRNSKITFNLIINKVAALFFAFVVFSLISKNFFLANTYSVKHFKTVFEYSNFLELLNINILESISNLVLSSSFFDNAILVLFFFFGMVFYCTLIFRENNKLLSAAIFFGSLSVVILAVLNPNIFLYTPRLYPRTYLGFGFVVFLCYFFIIFKLEVIEKIKSKSILIIKFIAFFPLVLSLQISYAGYNSIIELSAEESRIEDMILLDISRYTNFSHVIMAGKLDTTRRYDNNVNRFPVIANIFETKFNLNKHYAPYSLLENHKYSFVRGSVKDKNFVKQYDLVAGFSPNIERREYNIYVYNNKIYIFFKNNGVLLKKLDLPDRLT